MIQFVVANCFKIVNGRLRYAAVNASNTHFAPVIVELGLDKHFVDVCSRIDVPVAPSREGDNIMDGVGIGGEQLNAYAMPMGANMKFGVEFIKGDVDDIQFRDNLEAKLGVQYHI